MTTTETIASNLKRIRTELKIPQEEAAFRCEISTRHYNTIENGRANLSITTIDKLSRGFNITPAELIGIHNSECSLKFKCIETEINDDDLGTVKTYGIAIEIFQYSGKDNDPYTITCGDISTDHSKVERIVYLLNKLQPNIAHVEDIIEDFFVELDV